MGGRERERRKSGKEELGFGIGFGFEEVLFWRR